MFPIPVHMLCLLIPCQAQPLQSRSFQVEVQRIEARQATCRNAIERAAKLARNGDLSQLLSKSKSANDPLHRIVYGYALFRLNPRTYRTQFLDTFHNVNGLPVYLTLLDAFPSQDDAPIFPGDKRPFSYWSISEALLNQIKKGDRTSFRVWLDFAGGDGEYGEGRSEDFSSLLDSASVLVVSEWPMIRSRVNEFDTWGASPEYFEKLRVRYSASISLKNPYRNEILSLIQRLKSQAEQESRPDEESVVQVTP